VGRGREAVRREGRLKLHAPIAALLAGLLLAAPSWAELAGRVVAVHDGDTITVFVGGRDLRVRLAGIDAPERGQPFNNASRHALEARVAGREVRVVGRGRDGYGRILGRVYVGSFDVNAEQVRAGFAWHSGVTSRIRCCSRSKPKRKPRNVDCGAKRSPCRRGSGASAGRCCPREHCRMIRRPNARLEE